MRARLLMVVLTMIGSTALAAPAGKLARCAIQTGDGAYAGPCLFLLGPKGSFGLEAAKTRRLVGAITSLSVEMVGPNVAEVRGLTLDGINSRWGEAKRSKRDPACWQGSDFSVCVY
ncbi:MAG: hypothetical protein ABIO39_06600 [Caulobacteraceae bacterium]